MTAPARRLDNRFGKGRSLWIPGNLRAMIGPLSISQANLTAGET
jgi:hypothetical protein